MLPAKEPRHTPEPSNYQAVIENVRHKSRNTPPNLGRAVDTRPRLGCHFPSVIHTAALPSIKLTKWLQNIAGGTPEVMCLLVWASPPAVAAQSVLTVCQLVFARPFPKVLHGLLGIEMTSKHLAGPSWQPTMRPIPSSCGVKRAWILALPRGRTSFGCWT